MCDRMLAMLAMLLGATSVDVVYFGLLLTVRLWSTVTVEAF